MSIGPFERGPVRVILEEFSAAEQPATCREGDYTQASMLGNWWIDDREIAAYLVGLGMPAHYSEIEVERTDAATQAVHRWSWQTGSEESWMAFERNGATADRFHRVQRIFWFTDAMVAYMDFDMDEEYDIGAPSVGHLAPPSLYAFPGSVTPFVAARGGVYTALELSANLHYFGDLQCERPLA